MAQELNVRLEYSAEKDMLFVIALPEREIETRTMGHDDFFIFHEKSNPAAIVGIEVLSFGEKILALDREGISLPTFDCDFSISGSSLRRIHFKDLMKWAYGQFVAEARYLKAA